MLAIVVFYILSADAAFQSAAKSDNIVATGSHYEIGEANHPRPISCLDDLDGDPGPVDEDGFFVPAIDTNFHHLAQDISADREAPTTAIDSQTAVATATSVGRLIYLLPTAFAPPAGTGRQQASPATCL